MHLQRADHKPDPRPLRRACAHLAGLYDCEPPMQCPQLGAPESAFTGFDSQLRKHLFAQDGLKHVNYTVNAFASWAVRVRACTVAAGGRRKRSNNSAILLPGSGSCAPTPGVRVRVRVCVCVCACAPVPTLTRGRCSGLTTSPPPLPTAVCANAMRPRRASTCIAHACARWQEVSLRARNRECMGWAPFYQTSARDSCEPPECPGRFRGALTPLWPVVERGWPPSVCLLHFTRALALAGQGALLSVRPTSQNQGKRLQHM